MTIIQPAACWCCVTIETMQLMCITITRKHNHADGSHRAPCNPSSQFVLDYDSGYDSMDADDKDEVLFEAHANAGMAVTATANIGSQ